MPILNRNPKHPKHVKTVAGSPRAQLPFAWDDESMLRVDRAQEQMNLHAIATVQVRGGIAPTLEGRATHR